MLRTNLATQPFYNDRAVRVGIGVVIALVAALTAFNLLQVLSLNARNTEMTVRAESAEARTVQYQQQARTTTQALNTGTLSVVHQAADEANMLIARRVFSWTDLFNRFEETLPENVRVSAVEPQFDRAGRMLLAITVISRRVEDLNEFMDQLELSGGLHDVIARQDEALDDGTSRSVIQGYYVPSPQPAAVPPAASESSGQDGNDSPREPAAPIQTPPGGPR
jgi:Tfp pilus assembly protein PilN